VLVIDAIGNRTLPMLFDEQAELRPQHPWLVFEDRHGAVTEFTYAEFGVLVERLAAGFSEMGICPQDKVVVQLPNCVEFVLALFALARLGAVLVPCNPLHSGPEMEHVLRLSEAVALLARPRDLAALADVVAGIPAIRSLVSVGDAVTARSVPFAQLLETSTTATPPQISPEDPVQMLFTSGTTARPKAVVLTHANCLWSGIRDAHGVLLDHSDRLLTALPLFHLNAQSLSMLPALTVGGTLVLLEEYHASKFWEQIQAHRATQTALVAMLARTLMKQPALPSDAQHSLRRVIYAINMTEPERVAFEQRFGVTLINGYGLSEAMTTVSLMPVNGPKRWPSVGLPALGRAIRIIDDTGREQPPHEVGEIQVHGVPGRTLMKEYYNDPQATAETIVDGWLRTGDNGFLDEFGYLYFVDRTKDIIKRAGENVSASEVEFVLSEHPHVVRAAVIGVPDAIRDEAVKAYIELDQPGSLTAQELIRHCEARLAKFKVPTIVEFRDELPVTSVGKIEKKALRAESEQPAHSTPDT
jgi:carnitine-CoA ligase